MASMSFSLLFLLLLFIFLFSPFPSFSSTQCRPDEHSALLQLRSSFSVVDPSLAHCIREYENGTIYLMMSSWNKNTNCCEWDGVTCDNLTGHVIGLDLSCSRLKGTIHPNSSLFSLRHLQSLFLSYNELRIGAAAFKALAMNLTNLREFILSDSDMSTVPLVSLMNLSSSLTYLDLGYCQLHGELPQNIFQSHKLQGLDLEGNLLNGTIPSWIFELPYLVDLNIGLNSLTGEIHNFHSTSLQYLSLGGNKLHGVIPRSIFQQVKLQHLDLSSNNFTGPLPVSSSPRLVYFLASKNQFFGEISLSICNMTSLSFLDLSNNNLSGNIPLCFRNLLNSSLSVLDLGSNRFHGMIPPFFPKGNSLKTLNLQRNQLEGPLPESLLNCENLEVLDIGDNKINGSFPQWLKSLPKLQVLILRSNRFSGPISNPKVKFPFQKLRIMDLSNNEFTGHLPTNYFENFMAMMDAHMDGLEYMGSIGGYYQDSVVLVIKGYERQLEKILTIFTTIDFSRNSFEGGIPMSVGNLQSLKGLNFSHNKLTGQIPASLGNLSNLEWLDLCSNKLSGNIPLQLAASLNQLGILNLSSNELEGQIPHGNQFNTFNNDSYSGNPELCGFPLSKLCSNDEAQQHNQDDDDGDNKSAMIEWKVVMMGYGSGLVIGLSIGYMVLFSRSFDYWFFKRFGGGRRRRTSTRSSGRRRSN